LLTKDCIRTTNRFSKTCFSFFEYVMTTVEPMENCLSQCLEYITKCEAKYRDSIYDETLKPHWRKKRMCALGRNNWRKVSYSWNKRPYTPLYIASYKTWHGTTHAVVQNQKGKIVFNPWLVADLVAIEWYIFTEQRSFF
jgi:hypothetical protein